MVTTQNDGVRGKEDEIHMKKLSIVIPVYNESRTIRSILDKVAASGLPNDLQKEIIVVDDCSTDNTLNILSELKDKYGLRLIKHECNSGKGAATRAGLKEATGDFVIIQDADLEYNPADYRKLLQPLLDSRTNIAYGSRYLGRKWYQIVSVNFFANKILTAVSNFFNSFSLTDMETCYKIYSKKALDVILPRLKSDKFDIEPELTAAAAEHNLNIVEVPISYDPRTARQGKKIKWHDGFPALWAIIKYGIRPFLKKRKWQIAFITSLIILTSFFLQFIGPNILGDTPSYLQAIEVLNDKASSTDFLPNRILTTFLGLESIRIFSTIFGNIFVAWFFVNSLLYFLSCIFFFKLLSRILRSESTAFLGGLFLAANYGFLIFGLNYLMDIGGWAFYIFSLYFLYKYSQSKKTSNILLSALMVGIGGLFKEYAFLGAVAIGAFLILENWRDIKSLAIRAIQTASLALIPTIALYTYVYYRFGYTYLDWLGANQEHYVYGSRLIEYIKSLGSLVNILAFLFIGGVYILSRRLREIDNATKVFIAAILVSILPVFIWPAITQRILTITIPFTVIVVGYLFRKYQRYWYAFLPLLAAYILATFFMDSYILKVVNLPI